jgi:hypothetical protein
VIDWLLEGDAAIRWQVLPAPGPPLRLRLGVVQRGGALGPVALACPPTVRARLDHNVIDVCLHRISSKDDVAEVDTPSSERLNR